MGFKGNLSLLDIHLFKVLRQMEEQRAKVELMFVLIRAFMSFEISKEIQLVEPALIGSERPSSKSNWGERAMTVGAHVLFALFGWLVV